MRPSPLEIKAALLRPERILRDAALGYFADSFSQDPTILPAVAEAIERYGRFDAFDGLWRISTLAVSPEGVEWALEQRAAVPADDAADRRADRFRRALVELVQTADPAWQIAHAERLSARLPERGSFFNSWRELDRLDDQGLWQALADLSQDLSNSWDMSDAESDRSFQLIELLSRRGAFPERFLKVLERSDSTDAKDLPWDEIFATQWAGRARYAPAIPLLFRRLHNDEGLEEDCLPALRQINGDEVARLAAEGWLEGDQWLRLCAVELLGDVHGDFALRATLDLLRAEPAGEMRCLLGGSALRHFSPEACELLRDEVDLCDPKVSFRRSYVAAALLLGIDDPRLERFTQEEEAIRARVFALDDGGIADSNWNDLDFDAEDYVDDEDELDDEPFEREHTPSAAPLRAHKTAGRNDPCPCGSGKKFKKCCLRNGSIVD